MIDVDNLRETLDAIIDRARPEHSLAYKAVDLSFNEFRALQEMAKTLILYQHRGNENFRLREERDVARGEVRELWNAMSEVLGDNPNGPREDEDE